MKKRIPYLLILLCLFAIGVPAQSPHNITVTWTAPTTGGAVANYIILRGTTAGAEVQIATVPAGTLSYVDTTGVGGTAYFYTVEAKNSAGTSGPSNEVTATFLLDPPGTPAALKAVAN